MSLEFVTELARGAVWAAILLGAPVLTAALVVGVIISTVQAATQVNEMTLTFIPKLLAVGLVLWVAGGWMLEHWLSYTFELWRELETIGRSP